MVGGGAAAERVLVGARWGAVLGERVVEEERAGVAVEDEITDERAVLLDGGTTGERAVEDRVAVCVITVVVIKFRLGFCSASTGERGGAVTADNGRV